ncbi:uncharacterized protein LOC125224944 [Leguminivora glycinivorella]|uniref:uncharacterized protein LOC125224944 n=1 Tax=Leguminivora glycinivorella TaxID=1035111 RepID=UPI00200E9C44|nr:uncharacterized protein LOC125224944 [Leguminivora glycinivorella]
MPPVTEVPAGVPVSTAPSVTTAPLGSTTSTTDSSDVCKVGMRLPPFWPEDPEIWFSQVESSFDVAGINTDLTKYNYIVSQLDRQYAKEVRDVITNPPATDRYKKLKSELISRLSNTTEKQIQQLLHHEELGERKPSQFLRHLQALAANRISDDVLRLMWTNRLPVTVQTVLAGHPDASMDIIVDLADRVYDIGPRCACSSHVASASSEQPGSSNDALAREIAALRREVRDLKMDRGGGRSRPRDRSRSRRQSRSSTRSQSSYRKFPVCWYHSRHGENASKCLQPCDYNKSGNATGSR